MLTKTKLALAALLVVGTASTVLADSPNRTNHRGSVVRRAAPRDFTPVLSDSELQALDKAIDRKLTICRGC